MGHHFVERLTGSCAPSFFFFFFLLGDLMLFQEAGISARIGTGLPPLGNEGAMLNDPRQERNEMNFLKKRRRGGRRALRPGSKDSRCLGSLDGLCIKRAGGAGGEARAFNPPWFTALQMGRSNQRSI